MMSAIRRRLRRLWADSNNTNNTGNNMITGFIRAKSGIIYSPLILVQRGDRERRGGGERGRGRCEGYQIERFVEHKNE